MSRRITFLLAGCLATSALHAQSGTPNQRPQPDSARTATVRSDSTQPRRAGRFSSESWCEDDLTICLEGRAGRGIFNGVRIVFEPQLGVLFQSGENRLENTSFRALERIGIETNLSGAAVAFQALLMYPSTVEFDAKSPIRPWIKDTSGKVGVDYGIALGLSFLDGILAVGGGRLDYDQRDFAEKNAAGEPQPEDALQDFFLYFNVQPIAAIRSAIKKR
jgi:hypothetical protein